MKDIEKIKSEDLAAQVQDANPANFAIEQEVAQLVGATVPQPTEPSADDARELGAQLLVFLRRALTPIQLALRTAVAAIYAHLDSRCTAYTPAGYAPYQPLPSYDPMGTPPTPRTLPNLLTALTAFSARKISNGSAPNDGIHDGTSLAHLLCDTSAANAVTEIVDDNYGWTMNAVNYACDRLATLFANLSKVTINCKEITTVPYETDMWGVQPYPNYSIIYGEGVERIYTAYAINKKDTDTFVLPKVKTIAPFKTTASASANIGTPVLSRAKNILAPELEEWCLGTYNACGIQGNELRKFYAPKLKGISRLYGDDANGFVDTCPYLIHLEVGEGFVGWYGWDGYPAPRQISSVNFKKWEATMALRTDTDAEDYVDLREDMSLANNLQQFLLNFKTYIALRLTANGSGKTLTLSQAVRDAIHAAEATYGIEAIIVTQKGWTLSPAPTA